MMNKGFKGKAFRDLVAPQIKNLHAQFEDVRCTSVCGIWVNALYPGHFAPKSYSLYTNYITE